MYNIFPRSKMLTDTKTLRMKTAEARDKLSTIIERVQDPRSTVILTRYGRDVAAVVSMAELVRIHAHHDMEDITHNGHRPSMFTFGQGFRFHTNAEAAEHIQRVQLDRRVEREVLAKARLEPVPGGELVEEMEVDVEERGKRRWWW